MAQSLPLPPLTQSFMAPGLHFLGSSLASLIRAPAPLLRPLVFLQRKAGLCSAVLVPLIGF